MIENDIDFYRSEQEHIKNCLKYIVPPKKIVDSEGKLSKFNDVTVSTTTVIALTNLKIDLDRFFQLVPITDHTPLEKKRGRKPCFNREGPEAQIPFGSILLAQKRRDFRGSYMKGKTKKSQTYFLHSVTVVLSLNNNKIVNIKVSSNGKFQITGCKSSEHYTQTIIALFNVLRQIELMTGERVYSFQKIDEETSIDKLHVVFNTVMQNMDFHIGFAICRVKLDTFINNHTDFTSIFEGSIGTGVNIKVPSESDSYDTLMSISYDPLDKSCFLKSEEIKVNQLEVPFSRYSKFLEDKEKKKDIKKKKHHTFLVFASGSVIMSSRGPDMERVFYKLIETLLKHRSQFEDKNNKSSFYIE